MIIDNEDGAQAHKKIQDELFDYGSITDRDKKVVEELLKYVDGGLHDEIKEKFDIQSRPVYDVKKHPMWKICEDNNIALSLQGFNYSLEVGSTRYPIYAICEDFRKLEKLYEAVVRDTTDKLKQLNSGINT